MTLQLRRGCNKIMLTDITNITHITDITDITSQVMNGMNDVTMNVERMKI